MFDIVFINSHPHENNEWKKLKARFPLAKKAGSVKEAQDISLTEFVWVVYDDLQVNDYFDFDYIPDQWSQQYIHVFKNGTTYDGIALIPKYADITTKETLYRFYINKKEIDIQASVPKPFDAFLIDSYEDYLDAVKESTTEMFWMSSRNIKHEDKLLRTFYISHHDSQLRQQTHAFIHSVENRILYNGLFLCSKRRELTKREVEYRFPVDRIEHDITGSTSTIYETFHTKTYEDYLNALKQSKTEMFWIVPNYVNPTSRFKFDTYFSHDDQYNRTINHAYLNGKYHDGIVLCSKHAKFSKREFDYKFIAHKNEIDIVVSTPHPYDIVFISYQEPNADEYYRYVVDRFPRAKRVHGVKGIHQAHIEAAKLCTTDMFWIVDGDALIDSNFKFDYQVARWDKEVVHVWRSVNPINDLVYGYGGVKLFPTDLTINMDITKPDMTTSISSKFKAVNEISNVTGFNTDPFNTWKSAFRECTKLGSKIIDRQKDDETQQRLQTWCTKGKDRPFGEYALDGAKMGSLYGARNRNNIDMLKKINDFDWLQEQFDARNF